FITASFDVRMKRIMYVEGKDEKTVRRELMKSDKEHVRDYRFFTGHKWGFVQNYDFCINSESYGIDGSVDMILRLLNRSRKVHDSENFAKGDVLDMSEEF
ncbi:MAG: cytidylate kinase-like family protein, partial [Clostridia bacterium]|nr:cytidylate kinase-like family protein [Clostridia bacterium]